MEKKKGLYEPIRKKILKDYCDRLDGEALPSERKLAEIYGVKRSTVQYALRKIEADGRIYRIRGKGTFVRKDKPDRDNSSTVMTIDSKALRGVRGIYAVANTYGVEIRKTVLVRGTITNNRFLENKLGLSEGEPVYAMHGVRYGNGEPLAAEYTYLPQKLFPKIEKMDFSMVSLDDFMESCGHMSETFYQKLRIIKLSPKEARHLELEVGSPAFNYEYTARDSEGNIVEYTDSYYRCDKTEFTFSSRIESDL